MPSPDMQKFLYTILKQLDLKSVEWNQIAEATGITNGHAARMRYSRFKKQMEGHVPKSRTRKAPNPETPRKVKKAKEEEEKPLMSIEVKKEAEADPSVSNMPATPANQTARPISLVRTPPTTPKPSFIKNEPCEDGMASQLPLPDHIPPHEFNLESPLMHMNVASPHTHTNTSTQQPIQQSQQSNLMMFNHNNNSHNSLSDYNMDDSIFNHSYSSAPASNYMQSMMDFQFNDPMPSRAPQSFDSSMVMYQPRGHMNMNGNGAVKGQPESWDDVFGV